ncbi:UNVERIFIED_CONTAM: hypothetical protein Slati_0476000 [Sesamum latifolium]|uniref:Uncharacterized protein n=1 Tax=Sesamum latifolium TaxID=2727402 RepID=A0AAW2XWJ6_9LAMI
MSWTGYACWGVGLEVPLFALGRLSTVLKSDRTGWFNRFNREPAMCPVLVKAINSETIKPVQTSQNGQNRSKIDPTRARFNCGQSEGCWDLQWHTSSTGGRRGDAPSPSACRIYPSYLITGPSKKPRVDTRDRKPPFQRVNAVYTPLTVPITQTLIAVEGKGLLTRPRSWKDSPQRPKSDKLCRFHNDYSHTTEECRYLKNEIERLIQNGYLQKYVCSEKVRGTGLYQKQEGDKARETKAASPEHSPKEGTKYASGSKREINDPPSRKGVIRMIVGGPIGRDSQNARKSQVREAHNISMKEVLDVEAREDAPLIQFGQAERSGPKTSQNDALVITASLANYEVGGIFIDSRSSADILFGEAYDQM